MGRGSLVSSARPTETTAATALRRVQSPLGRNHSFSAEIYPRVANLLGLDDDRFRLQDLSTATHFDLNLHQQFSLDFQVDAMIILLI